eukprot:8310398-Pyramimonas_sp.AAC.1
MDSAAATFRHQHAIRTRAREQAMEGGARSKLSLALRSEWHRDRAYQPGDWVYVWRRAPSSGKKPFGFQRDRWVGPGSVIYRHATTVWVGVRGKLWECSSEQIRPATQSEPLGAELAQSSAHRSVLSKGFDQGIT